MIVPVSLNDNAHQTMARQLPPALLCVDIVVEFAGVGRVLGLVDSDHDMAIMELTVIESGIRTNGEAV